ncbi:phospholipase D family protein [Burkholderia pseudomallei]
MKIMLHPSEQPNELRQLYRAAFNDAVELYIVSAYLTEKVDFTIGRSCRRFRFIVGKDFGITRKDACRHVLKRLPASQKANFLVADQIMGFHPKTVIWRTANGQTWMIIGSSNLSRAAFNSNVEANILVEVSKQEFERAKTWIDEIETCSVPVSEDWLERYVEAARNPGGHTGKHKRARQDGSPVITFKLPWPSKIEERLRDRRKQLAIYAKQREGLVRLFQRAARAQISSAQFFAELPEHWSIEKGNRLQYKGWERTGKSADFREVAKAFIAVLDADKRDRDDVVRSELDHLAARRNPARRAFLSEMLCLRFPHQYPVLNNPVHQFLKENRFAPPRGASEGARYIDLAKKLRMALRTNPDYPAKNLAELDLLIWASSEYNPSV